MTNTATATTSPRTVADNSSEFLNVTEAAGFLRISPVTLCRWRVEGIGPLYRKFGRRVLYARSDLRTWADVQRRRSTSETADLMPGLQP